MTFEQELTGGNPRTLGRVDEVIKQVSANQSRLGELFDCMASDDEIVRMRASDALEKLCRQNPAWFQVYIERLLHDWPKIRQPSVQWHLAQMLSEISLSASEKQQAIAVLKNNLETMNDWIVTNLTLESLAVFARDKSLDTHAFKTIVHSQADSPHRSVKSRVNKLLKEFGDG